MGQPRVLAYDRVDANKRRTRWLLVVFGLVSLPAAVFLAVYLTFFFAVVLGMLFGTLTAGGALAGDNWMAWAVAIPVLAAIIAVLTPVAIFWRAAYLILRLSGARPLGEGEQPELRRSVENLCIGSGLPAPGLYLVESSAANAFSTGLSPENSSLVVTTGLLDLLDRRELEGVLAHELVQIGNYDTRVSTILAAGVAFLRVPFTAVVGVMRFLFRLHWAVGWFVLLYLGLPVLVSIPLAFALGFTVVDEDPEQAAVLWVTMSIPLYSLAVAPLLAEFIRAGVSRQSQFLADADAVLLGRSAEPLAIALVKMHAAGMSGLDAARSSAHLWTVDPLPEQPLWERFWPDYHPPVEERVELLARMGAGIAGSDLERAATAGTEFRAESSEVVPQSLHRYGVSQVAEVAPVLQEQRAPVAYRLSAPDTTVWQRADVHSSEVARLAAGSLVAIHGEEGRFLHVITPNDQFGYIEASAPMTPVDPPRDDTANERQDGA
jgi:heat shock protein HtpX